MPNPIAAVMHRYHRRDVIADVLAEHGIHNPDLAQQIDDAVEAYDHLEFLRSTGLVNAEIWAAYRFEPELMELEPADVRARLALDAARLTDQQHTIDEPEPAP